MELRCRSRSKTPFQTESFIEAESFGGSNHVTVTRSTRRTTVRTSGSGGSSEYLCDSTTKPVKSKSTKSARSVFKTSDYSSEEGEFDGNTHISENEKNQIIEDAIAAANGTAEVSALNLYRKAGRYWDIYPKTDYTYSRHSRDRVEIAPGVVQMPNMSRRTIHADSSTNTDSFFTSKSHLVKQRLFSSNNNEEIDESYTIRRASSTRRRTVTSVITSVFTSIYTAIYWCFYTVYQKTHSTMIYGVKQLHHVASRVMLLDTWLLRKSAGGGKRTKAVVALCLLPLLFFAGLHALLASGVSLAPFCHPHCGRYISTYYNSFINAASNVFQ